MKHLYSDYRNKLMEVVSQREAAQTLAHGKFESEKTVFAPCKLCPIAALTEAVSGEPWAPPHRSVFREGEMPQHGVPYSLSDALSYAAEILDVSTCELLKFVETYDGLEPDGEFRSLSHCVVQALNHLQHRDW